MRIRQFRIEGEPLAIAESLQEAVGKCAVGAVNPVVLRISPMSPDKVDGKASTPPESEEERSITFKPVDSWPLPKGLSIFGLTPDNAGGRVTISTDPHEQPTLMLVDTEAPDIDIEETDAFSEDEEL